MCVAGPRPGGGPAATVGTKLNAATNRAINNDGVVHQMRKLLFKTYLLERQDATSMPRYPDWINLKAFFTDVGEIIEPHYYLIITRPTYYGSPQVSFPSILLF